MVNPFVDSPATMKLAKPIAAIGSVRQALALLSLVSVLEYEQRSHYLLNVIDCVNSWTEIDVFGTDRRYAYPFPPEMIRQQ